MDLSALKDFTDSFFTGMPDLQHPLDELITEGDKVALRGRYAGTHTGGATAKRAAATTAPTNLFIRAAIQRTEGAYVRGPRPSFSCGPVRSSSHFRQRFPLRIDDSRHAGGGRGPCRCRWFRRGRVTYAILALSRGRCPGDGACVVSGSGDSGGEDQAVRTDQEAGA